jgi:sulfide:quinone oxidoreductase
MANTIEGVRASGSAAALRRNGTSKPVHHRTVVVGGGTAGITVAARLRRSPLAEDIAVIEPSDKHYYQPMWTLVGGGEASKESTERSEADVIPAGVRWIRDGVAEFFPEVNRLVTRDGVEVTYDYLVVAAGIQVNWGAIKGLPEALGRDGVCSNYSYQHVDKTWEYLRGFRGGNAVFTQPGTAIKCAGAPQKIAYLADDQFRRAGVRDRSTVIFASAMPGIFAVPHYAPALQQVVNRKGIETRFRHDLVEVVSARKQAVFKNLDTGETILQSYDLLHVTPPMSSPDFIRHSPLADGAGWVDVDKHTLRHPRFPNVFSLGDCSSAPTSKTGAAIRKQAPVVVANLVALAEGREPVAKYDGYASCPLVTGYGKLILAEFNYDKQPVETFPFDQRKERWSMYQLKKHVLPRYYWAGMLKGRG